MHRIPQQMRASSRVCDERNRARSYNRHRAKLENIKGRVDNSPPKEQPHLRSNPKGVQLERERLAKIEYENTILLNKMKEIMTKPSKFEDSPNHQPKSLNKEKRRREQERIDEENLALLKRLENVPAVYSSKKLDDDAKKQEKYLRNACIYPPSLRSLSPDSRSSVAERGKMKKTGSGANRRNKKRERESSDTEEGCAEKESGHYSDDFEDTETGEESHKATDAEVSVSETPVSGKDEAATTGSETESKTA